MCVWGGGARDIGTCVARAAAASVALPLTAMNAAGRAAAEVAVSGLRVRGQTNIWAGLEAAMDALRGGVAAAGRQQSVLLLTDGQPNVVPRGGVAGEDPHVTAMRRYAVAHGGFACTVRTFGFGYDLDSELLLQVRARRPRRPERTVARGA